MLFTLSELLDIVIMTFIIGYIFKDIIPVRGHPHEITINYLQQMEYARFKFAVIAVAPAIILHELGHKFAALAFGIVATFHAAYGFLLFGLVMKLLNFPFIFFVPAYVSHGPATAFASIVIAFAGPLINGVLWFAARYAIRHRLISQRYYMLAAFTQYVNGFLFVLNMLPIPGFDGFHVVYGLAKILF